ncbi:hypothetical protein ACIOFZ_27380, partial [Streptomyces nodosus]
MRVTRTMFASAAVAAAFALAAPAAHAVTMADHRASEAAASHDGKEHDKHKDRRADDEGWAAGDEDEDSDPGREHKHHHKHHKHHKHHDGPRGGIRAGGGALAMTKADDDEGWAAGDEDEDSDAGREHKHHDGPRGGVKAGGGALAMTKADDDEGWAAGDEDEDSDPGRE